MTSPEDGAGRIDQDGEFKTAKLTYHDLVRTGPGTLAGGYLRRFWQPVYRAADLASGQAKPLRVMSEDFTIFRGDSGTAYVGAGHCAHRGAQLSVGRVEGDAIRCAYHAWKYEGADGRCVDQPAEPRPFCDLVRIRTYPTREYLGMIFAYLGDGEPPEFPRLPEFEDPEFLHTLRVDVWPVNFFAQLENAMDYAHTEFLHWHFRFKTPEKVIATEMPYGVKIYTPGLSGVTAAYDTGIFHMPNAHEWAAPPPRDEKVGNYARGWRVPVDDNTHIRFNLDVYPLKGEVAAAYKERNKARWNRIGPSVPDIARAMIGGKEDFQALRNQTTIAGGDLVQVQDCTVMMGLGPIAVKEHREFLGQTDLGIVLMRRLWMQELQAFAAGMPQRHWQRPDCLWQEMVP